MTVSHRQLYLFLLFVLVTLSLIVNVRYVGLVIYWQRIVFSIVIIQLVLRAFRRATQHGDTILTICNTFSVHAALMCIHVEGVLHPSKQVAQTQWAILIILVHMWLSHNTTSIHIWTQCLSIIAWTVRSLLHLPDTTFPMCLFMASMLLLVFHALHEEKHIRTVALLCECVASVLNATNTQTYLPLRQESIIEDKLLLVAGIHLLISMSKTSLWIPIQSQRILTGITAIISLFLMTMMTTEDTSSKIRRLLLFFVVMITCTAISYFTKRVATIIRHPNIENVCKEKEIIKKDK